LTVGDTHPPSSAATPSLDDKVAFLKRRNAYPEQTRQVESVETHMSWVFLTDQYAYKLKKPIRYDVLDFSRIELRRRSCHRELRLNRRLAPQVYIDVVPLSMEGYGELQLAGSGVVVDWLVKMVRLPAERMLDRVIADGALHRADVEPAAAMLARFYEEAIPALIDGAGYRQHLQEGIPADREELVTPVYQLPAEAVLRVAHCQLQYVEESSQALDRRVQEGRVVEGHGDLRPEHICLTDPPAIIDCLEFSRDLRILDPADELSFLALECERLGAPAVGPWFFDRYRDVTGDDPPSELLDFYRRFRALRRAKIAIWHLREPGIDRAEEWRERAEWYIQAADLTGERAQT
jgi:aminoglycoside phosphotransferase family enzyme